MIITDNEVLIFFDNTRFDYLNFTKHKLREQSMIKTDNKVLILFDDTSFYYLNFQKS